MQEITENRHRTFLHEEGEILQNCKIRCLEFRSSGFVKTSGFLFKCSYSMLEANELFQIVICSILY